MKSALRILLSRPVFLLAAAVALPLLLTQCKTGAGNYKNIEYDPATLRTPPGHGLEKKDYPFDDEGNYRKDWVRNKSGGRTRTSYNAPAEPEPAAAPTTPASSQPRANYQDLAAATAPPAPSAPPPAAAPSYHRVASGDTLYSLAGRYGTTVEALKRTNGLTGDSIRAGQTLRIP